MKITYFFKASFQSRLILTMGLMLLPLVVLAAGSLLLLGSMNNALDDVAYEMTESFQPIIHLQTLVLEATYPAHHYLIYGHTEERDNFIRLSQEVDKAFAGVLAISTESEKKNLVLYAQEEWRQIQAISQSILGIPTPRMETVTSGEMKALHISIDRIVIFLDQLHLLSVSEAYSGHAKARAIAERALLLAALVFSVGFGIAFIAVILLIRSVMIPVRLLRQGAENFGKGDLAYRISLASKDELGELARVFNAMAETLERDQAALEELATHDGLTGLLNHREFQRLLSIEIERSQRYKHNLSLLIVDIDHFKVVNDTYGHHTGDIVLRALAAQMRQLVRGIDYAARYGGEEFTIILPEMSATNALAAAERLRKSIANQSIVLDERQVVNVTVSIGVATFPEDADSKNKLIATADRALYAAKSAGRNRVLRAGEMRNLLK